MVRVGRRQPLGDDRPLNGDDLRTRVSELTVQPGYRALLAEVRTRLEAYGRPAQVTLQGLDGPARDALADLLGHRRRPAATTTVRVDELDRSLRNSRVGAGLVDVLEAMGGPLRDQRDESRRRRAAWDAVYAELGARAQALAGRGGAGVDYVTWAGALRSDGLLTRLGGEPDRALALGTQALDVLARLPAEAVPLSVLAAEVTGDPHSLDAGAPLATLVLRGAAALTGREGLPSGARARRRLWGAVGVVCDPLSSSVLVFGLRPQGSGLLARTLADHASVGEPVRVTLSQLTHSGATAYEPAPVSVCENPAVMVAAAEQLNAACAPLLCTEGVPDVAADRLLRDLRQAGCALRFHADFDGGGIRIGNLLHGRFTASPWRMAAADYEHVVAAAEVTAALRGPVADARWDAALAAAMRRRGRAVAEEQVLGELLGDLGAGSW